MSNSREPIYLQLEGKWAREQWAVLDRELTFTDVDLLERELELRMPWAFEEHEAVLGFRILAEAGVESEPDTVILSVVRQMDARLQRLPGVVLEFGHPSTADTTRWDDLRAQSVSVFGRLAASPLVE